MRSSQFIFFCLLFTFFYLRSMDLLHSPPRLFTSEGRPARKYLGTSFSNYPKSEYHEVHEDEFNRPSPKDMSSNTPEHEASVTFPPKSTPSSNRLLTQRTIADKSWLSALSLQLAKIYVIL
uniref:Uncharacterized protein n=1 Tax=Cucumis melo TaxID=3656 RepID=A0A9I9DF11_CUCME